ncbi:prickle-like protein 4 isoform X2 [Sceloporus undulatus]|uniref:prickle-like protein 4 isoform X2 n=1 Tax=Sceloporus undulatus TaxID=8520 RepID=UPI001C4BD102|nr:prickle-like protein 4 isoform X2 [Sceloporus undulatus]
MHLDIILIIITTTTITTTRSSTFLRMSQPSPTCSQREKAPCSGTLGTLLPVSSSDSDSGCALEDYLGPTSEIALAEVSSDFGNHSSDAIPTIIQNQLRIKTLLQQLPPQDCDERYCSSIGEEEREQLRTFAARRRQESLGQGVRCLVPPTTNEYSCKKCGKMIFRGQQVVFTPKLGDQFCWHPSCFVCHTCHEPLVDLIYFHHHEKIYCGRHHAEFFRPRCASCDQLIFTTECMEAEGMRWHEEHFCCLECDLPLGARRYVMKGGQPCCCACFESLYADICQACGEIIGVDSEQATLQGQHWHAKTSCFCCSLCQKALVVDQPVITQNGLLFCSEACSLEKESTLSFSGSDSSDSAFISAPSPDSTPLSRVRNSNTGCSTEAAGTSCETSKEIAAMESLYPSGNSSIGPECGSQEEADIVFRSRMLSPQHDECESLIGSLQKAVQISTSSLEAAWSSTSQREDHSLGTTLLQASQQQVGDHHFRSGLSVAPHAAVLNMDVPETSLKDSTAEQEAVVEQGDAWCPNWSSSSDSESEPEGFFFGKPIPKPRARHISLPGMEQETLGKGTRWATRARTNSKHCSIA